LNSSNANARRPEHAQHDSTLWQPQVLQLSALKAQGLDAFWAQVTRFLELQTANGRLAARRRQQNTAWMWERIDAGLRAAFRKHPRVRLALPGVLQQVDAAQLLPSVAARRLLREMGLAQPAEPRAACLPAETPTTTSVNTTR
jgi:LAO/AO transport system kinase